MATSGLMNAGAGVGYVSLRSVPLGRRRSARDWCGDALPAIPMARELASRQWRTDSAMRRYPTRECSAADGAANAEMERRPGQAAALFAFGASRRRFSNRRRLVWADQTFGDALRSWLRRNRFSDGSLQNSVPVRDAAQRTGLSPVLTMRRFYVMIIRPVFGKAAACDPRRR